MKLDIYKSVNSGIEYYLIKSFRGPYASFRRCNTSDKSVSLLRKDMVFVRSVYVP